MPLPTQPLLLMWPAMWPRQSPARGPPETARRPPTWRSVSWTPRRPSMGAAGAEQTTAGTGRATSDGNNDH